MQQCLAVLGISEPQLPWKEPKMHPFSKVSLYNHLEIPSASNWSPPLYFLSMLGLPLLITPIHKFSIHVFVPLLDTMSSCTCRCSILAQRRCSVSISRIYFWNLFESSFKDIPQNADSLKFFLFVARLMGLLLRLPISESSNAE